MKNLFLKIFPDRSAGAPEGSEQEQLLEIASLSHLKLCKLLRLHDPEFSQAECGTLESPPISRIHSAVSLRDTLLLYHTRALKELGQKLGRGSPTARSHN